MGGLRAIARDLRCCVDNGINGDELDMTRRRKCYGANVYPKPLIKGLWYHIKQEALSPMMIILIVLATLSICFGLY